MTICGWKLITLSGEQSVILFNRSTIFYAILLGSIMLLPGCAKVGPDYIHPKTDVSKTWLEEKDGRVRTSPAEYRAWWEVFDDPILNSIIERAYRENLTLRIAGVRVLEARAQLGVAVGNLYPQTQQASGSVTYNRLSEKELFAGLGQTFGVPGGGSSFSFSYWQDQVNANAIWEIDFWGKFRRAIESADASLLMSVADYDSALVSLTADAARFYIQIRTLQKRLEIARQNVETQKESLEIALTRYKGGVSSERDVEQAKTVLFNTRATVPLLQAQLRQAQNGLCVLLAIPPTNLDDILGDDKTIPAPPPYVAVGIPADLLRRRPDVRSAELKAESQSALIGVAKADLYPSFSLTGSFGFLATSNGSSKLTDMFGWSARTATAGPSIQWNFLNYGRITNNVRVQDARFQELLITYQHTVLQAQQEVEDSLAGFLRAQENAEYLAQSAKSAKRSLDLATIQYQQGVTDFTTVLVAQQALLTAQDNFASALGSISSNLVGVYRSLGGGWEIRSGQDIVPPEIKEAMAKRTNWGKLLTHTIYPVENVKPVSEIRFPDW